MTWRSLKFSRKIVKSNNSETQVLTFADDISVMTWRYQWRICSDCSSYFLGQIFDDTDRQYDQIWIHRSCCDDIDPDEENVGDALTDWTTFDTLLLDVLFPGNVLQIIRMKYVWHRLVSFWAVEDWGQVLGYARHEHTSSVKKKSTLTVDFHTSCAVCLTNCPTLKNSSLTWFSPLLMKSLVFTCDSKLSCPAQIYYQ